jgi:hypothetical protein
VNAGIVSATGLRISNSIFFCEKLVEEEAADLWSVRNWFETQVGNKSINPNLSGFFPNIGSPALGMGVTPDDLYFDPVDYIGAFASAQDDWTAGWSTKVEN